MRRLSLALLFASIVSFVVIAPATASVHPNGSTSCIPAGSGKISPPLSGSVPSTRTLRAKIKGTLSACDNSGIVGSTYPITSGAFEISAKLPVGSTCFTLLSNPFTTAKIKLKWYAVQVVDGVAHNRRQGSSTGVVASASIHTENGDYGLRFVSNPITGSAFAGQIMTVELDLGDVTTLANACETPGGTISAVTVNGESVDVAGYRGAVGLLRNGRRLPI